jgi:hypothetical protein
MLLEFCCSDKSVLGEATIYSEGCEVVRLTEQIDMTTEKGLQFAVNKARQAPHGRLLLWSSIPCTGGCRFVRYNLARFGSTYRRKLQQHRELFQALLTNLIALASVVHSMGGKIAIEWPDKCTYWDDERVKSLIQTFDLRPTRFDGCMYGLRSIVPGCEHMPIKKPWMLMTNSDILSKNLSLRCNGRHKHKPCQGADTKVSEGYTPMIAAAVHSSFFWSSQKAMSDPPGGAPALPMVPWTPPQQPVQQHTAAQITPHGSVVRSFLQVPGVTIGTFVFSGRQSSPYAVAAPAAMPATPSYSSQATSSAVFAGQGTTHVGAPTQGTTHVGAPSQANTMPQQQFFNLYNNTRRASRMGVRQWFSKVHRRCNQLLRTRSTLRTRELTDSRSLPSARSMQRGARLQQARRHRHSRSHMRRQQPCDHRSTTALLL